MTVDQIMLIIGILMVVGSLGWMLWDVLRKSRARRRQHDAWLEDIQRRINEDKEQQ